MSKRAIEGVLEFGVNSKKQKSLQGSSPQYYNLQVVIHDSIRMGSSTWQPVEVFLTKSKTKDNVSTNVDDVIDNLVTKVKQQDSSFPLQVASDECFTEGNLKEKGYSNYKIEDSDYKVEDGDDYEPIHLGSFALDPKKEDIYATFKGQLINYLKSPRDDE